MSEAWIIDAVRSPRGRGKPGVGSLSNLHPQRCMAQVLNGLRDKVGFRPTLKMWLRAAVPAAVIMLTILRACRF